MTFTAPSAEMMADLKATKGELAKYITGLYGKNKKKNDGTAPKPPVVRVIPASEETFDETSEEDLDEKIEAIEARLDELERENEELKNDVRELEEEIEPLREIKEHLDALKELLK
jgi:chromosome segregation ATPase